MMALKVPTFPRNATESQLYDGALKVQTTAQAVTYMQGLVRHHCRLYGFKYASNETEIKSIQWNNMKRYAERTGYPKRGMQDLRRVYQMSRAYGMERMV